MFMKTLVVPLKVVRGTVEFRTGLAKVIKGLRRKGSERKKVEDHCHRTQAVVFNNGPRQQGKAKHSKRAGFTVKHRWFLKSQIKYY